MAAGRCLRQGPVGEEAAEGREATITRMRRRIEVSSDELAPTEAALILRDVVASAGPVTPS